MIDLHLHLDGSLSAATILKLAKSQNVQLPTDNEEKLKLYLTVDKDCDNLLTYLEKFSLPLSLLQTREALRESAYNLLQDLQAKNMKYVELRFAPRLHCQKGLTQEQVCEAVIEGLNLGMEQTTVKGQLILCWMRGVDGDAKEVYMETILAAEKFLGKGVCGMDLAGAEAIYPTQNYRELFSIVKEKQIPFTIHAGEAAGPESIWAALEMGACRIGHGIRAREDEALMEYLAEHQIPLETCPTSNVQTQAVSCMQKHPLLDYLDRGLLVTINTDNMTVSGTDIWNEYDTIKKVLGMSREQQRQLFRNSVRAAFLSEVEKQKLWEEVEKALLTNNY